MLRWCCLKGDSNNKSYISAFRYSIDKADNKQTINSFENLYIWKLKKKKKN